MSKTWSRSANLSSNDRVIVIFNRICQRPSVSGGPWPFGEWRILTLHGNTCVCFLFIVGFDDHRLGICSTIWIASDACQPDGPVYNSTCSSLCLTTIVGCRGLDLKFRLIHVSPTETPTCVCEPLRQARMEHRNLVMTRDVSSFHVE